MGKSRELTGTLVVENPLAHLGGNPACGMNRAKLHWSLFIEAKLHWGESEGVQGPPPIFPCLACLASLSEKGRPSGPTPSPGRPLPRAQSLSGRPDWPDSRPPRQPGQSGQIWNPGISDPGIEILGSEIRVWESGSGIWDPGSRIRDPEKLLVGRRHEAEPPNYTPSPSLPGQ